MEFFWLFSAFGLDPPRRTPLAPRIPPSKPPWLPFIAGPLGSRATVQTFLDIGGLGDFSVYFHAVVAGANCVALIYDTRYQEGQQYCPPYDAARHADGLPIRITVPHADRAKTRTYETKYFGQKFVLGVLDVILVVTNPSGEEE